MNRDAFDWRGGYVVEALTVVIEQKCSAHISLVREPVRHTGDRPVLLLVAEHGGARMRRGRPRNNVRRRVRHPTVVSKERLKRRTVLIRISRRHPNRESVAGDIRGGRKRLVFRAQV